MAISVGTMEQRNCFGEVIASHSSFHMASCPRHHSTRQTSCRVVEGQVVRDDLLGPHYSRSREMRGRRADQANTWIIISMVWEHTFPLQIFQVLLTLWTGCRHSNASCGSEPFCVRLACLNVVAGA